MRAARLHFFILGLYFTLEPIVSAAPDINANLTNTNYFAQTHRQDNAGIAKYNFQLLQKSAAQSDPVALLELANFYFHGDGVPQDYKKSIWYLHQSAFRGNPDAEYILGTLYWDGTRMAKNPDKALDFFEAAAKNGNADAQENLGDILWVGVNSPPNYSRAFFWISKAAAEGQPTAAGDLGIMYEEGIGTPRDILQSLKWCELASKEGFTNVQPRLEEVMALADRDQQRDAGRMAAAFKPLPLAPMPLEDSQTGSSILNKDFQIYATVFGETNLFIIDTGSTYTWLDTKYKAALGDEIISEASSSVPGLPVVALYSCPEILIGEKRVAPLWTACQDFEMVREIFGTACGGILGMDTMKNRVIGFDSDRNTFLIGGMVSEAISKNSLIVPLKKMQNRRDAYAIDASINGSSPIRFMIDSGDNGSIMLTKEDWQKTFGTAVGEPHEGMTWGLGGITHSQITRFGNLAIGTNVYTNLIVRLSSAKEDLSSLGQGFLRRNNVAIDFPKQIMYLQRSQHFADADRLDRSGLHLLRIDNVAEVYSVDEGSPAFLAGIRAGDKIVSINGQKTASLDMDTIRERLKNVNNQQIYLKAMHGGEIEEFSLSLEHPL